jgi:alanine-synthesizing transaminase
MSVSACRRKKPWHSTKNNFSRLAPTVFSQRTNWQRNPNKLSELLDFRRRSGQPVIDLTVSNPTELGLPYPITKIESAFISPALAHYRPAPRGIPTAREAVVRYYAGKNQTVDPEDVFLTASTSEAYSLLMKLLCNPGEEILVPRPSYPLFEYLAQINDVRLTPYRLVYDGSWHIDISSIRSALSLSTRAIVLVSPHNPTGALLSGEELAAITRIASERSLPLIVDEVFIDYSFSGSHPTASTAGITDTLTFTLNGLSKFAGLPQMKLGWVVLSGAAEIRREAAERLEILCDTFLSVNTPVQTALPALMEIGSEVQKLILDRVKGNYRRLGDVFGKDSPCSVLSCHAGWYAILRLPNIKTDEQWALALLEKCGVSVFPGYFFEMENNETVVLSLLPEPKLFSEGILLIAEFVGRSLS